MGEGDTSSKSDQLAASITHSPTLSENTWRSDLPMLSTFHSGVLIRLFRLEQKLKVMIQQ